MGADVFPYLAESDAVIAMSDFNARYFARALPSHVAVKKILYPLMPAPTDYASKDQARKLFHFGQNDFIVFFNFDISAGYRKNPEGVMVAFNCKRSPTGSIIEL